METIFESRWSDISCICWFTAEGQPVPLLYEICSTDGKTEKFTIITILDTFINAKTGIKSYEFVCKSLSPDTGYTESSIIFLADKMQWKLKV